MSGGTTTIQRANMEQVNLLSTFFQRRNEAAFSMAKGIGILKSLAGLRGAWPLSSADESGWAYDMSGQGRTLRYQGNPRYGYDSLAPYIALDGNGDFLQRVDEAGLDITGAETTILADQTGIALGGWFQVSSQLAAAAGLITKWVTIGNQRSYLLGVDANNFPYFSISGDGTAEATVTHTTALAVDTWYFVAGRYENTNGTISVYVNDVRVDAIDSIPASIFSSTAVFNIGAINNLSVLPGRASLCWLCANRLTDAIIWTIYQQTRSMYGKQG